MTAKQLDKTLATLLKRGLIEERETRERSATYRSEDDVGYGLFITREGLAAVNISSDDEGLGDLAEQAPPPTPRQNKSELVHSQMAPPSRS